MYVQGLSESTFQLTKKVNQVNFSILYLKLTLLIKSDKIMELLFSLLVLI